MSDQQQKILSYYRRNASEYIKETLELDMHKERDFFLDLVKDGGHILDIGCGSGRDSRVFIDSGYMVTAIDACPEIAELTSEFLGQKVVVQNAQDINQIENFDGIWSCASLLHVPDKELINTFKKIVTALKIGGVWYISFKDGSGENWDERGRFFNYHTISSMHHIIDQLTDTEIISISKDTTELRGKAQSWLNIFLRKCIS